MAIQESARKDDVLYSTVVQLGEMLRGGRITSMDLTLSYIERIKQVDPKLNAFITVTEGLAVQQAERADKELQGGSYLGPLHGIPYGAKDLLATKGIPTTWGSEPYRDQVFDFDATVVRKLREAGAVLVAKLAMIELAGGFSYNNADACFTGPCRTPWDLDYWSGGSSSGPGASVAAAPAPFPTGSGTSGSTITPAAVFRGSRPRATHRRGRRPRAVAPHRDLST